MAYTSNVVFNSGEPIDVNKLNQLQANINNLVQKTDLTNSTTTSLGRQVASIPIVDCGQVTIITNAATAADITFKNKGFTVAPTIVASLASNLPATGERLYAVRATALSATNAKIEVTTTKDQGGKEILVNWIAIQMKEIGE